MRAELNVPTTRDRRVSGLYRHERAAARGAHVGSRLECALHDYTIAGGVHDAPAEPHGGSTGRRALERDCVFGRDGTGRYVGVPGAH